MKRFLFAVATIALVASVGSAEDKPVVTQPAKPVTVTVPDGTSNTILVGERVGAPVVAYGTTTTTARRGLFSRLRNRGTTTGTYTTGPVVTGTGTVVSPAPILMPTVPAPMPMPGTKTTPGAMTTPNGIIIVGGTTESGVITTAGYSEPAPRRGFMSRLRNR